MSWSDLRERFEEVRDRAQAEASRWQASMDPDGSSSKALSEFVKPNLGPTPERIRRYLEPVIATAAAAMIAVLLGMGMPLTAGVVFEAQYPEIQGLELLVGTLLVQDPDHRVLAVDRRHDRNAEVDRPSRHPHLETPVLGDALLGDIQLRHNLDPADYR